MAAFDYQQGKRKHGIVHDWFPLIAIAVICFLVVAFNVKL
jgi:hypothetical protein